MGTETNISKPLIIANSDTWIEGNAVQQLETTAKLPHMRQAGGGFELLDGIAFYPGVGVGDEMNVGDKCAHGKSLSCVSYRQAGSGLGRGRVNGHGRANG